MAARLRPLEALGGRYDLSHKGEVTAHNCLFREACDAARVVCEFHAGLLEALLEPAGMAVESTGPEGTAGCAYRLAAAGARETSIEEAAS